jgi:2-polyprenylphenol 6-hydroxylase
MNTNANTAANAGAVAIDFDALIIGGGPVGAATAALLAREAGLPASRIGLLAPDLAQAEAATPADAPPQLRVSAIARASQRVLQRAGAWPLIPAARIGPYERMRVGHESMPADALTTLTFDAAELAEPDLGAIIENHLITRASVQSFRASGGTLIAGAMQSLRVEADAVTVTASVTDASAAHATAPGGERTLRTRLVIGADGAHSAVRAQLGIRVHTHDYGQLAIVGNVSSARPHQRTASQRFLATGPVALLPLYNGQCSIVWSATAERARESMALPAEEFSARLSTATDHVLGQLTLTSERAAFPLARVSSSAMISPRAAIVGDAAHQVHPLAGQGVNLGFLDAAALCDAVRRARNEGEDIGALRALRPYEQARYTHNLVMSNAMSAFNFAFSRGGLAGEAAAWALGLAGNQPFIRQFFARQAMGT